MSNNATLAVDVTQHSAAAAAGNGTVLGSGGLAGVCIQVTGTFTATIIPKGTLVDTDNLVTLPVVNVATGGIVSSSSITGTGIYFIPLAGVDQFYSVITSYSSGTVTVRAKGVSVIPPWVLVAFQTTGVLGTVVQGSQGSVGSPWFTRHTDGTNYLPTLDAVGRRGYVQITDGTNSGPSMDAAARPGYFTPVGTTSNGLSKSKARDLTSTVTAIKASAGTLYALTLLNTLSQKAFVGLWDAATGSVTLGTTNPDWEVEVLPQSMLQLPLPIQGLPFGTAISIASVTAERGSAGSSTTPAGGGVQAFWAYQ